ncbi:hypothetical protein ACSBR1_034291 [Camellia fascicularis]
MLELENIAGSRILELRKKQFALLLHVVCSKMVFCNVLFLGKPYCQTIIGCFHGNQIIMQAFPFF